MIRLISMMWYACISSVSLSTIALSVILTRSKYNQMCYGRRYDLRGFRVLFATRFLSQLNKPCVCVFIICIFILFIWYFFFVFGSKACRRRTKIGHERKPLSISWLESSHFELWARVSSSLVRNFQSYDPKKITKILHSIHLYSQINELVLVKLFPSFKTLG